MNIEFVKDILAGAGEILRDGFGITTEIQTKQDQSNIVTESDFKSEEYLRSKIIAAYPSHNLLGEENGFENRSSEYTWIIDPLDGTSNFASHLPWFGVLVALLKHDKPILSGAYMPLSDELYYATKGGGAYKNDQLINTSNENNLKNLLCCYSLDFSSNDFKTSSEVQVIKRLVQNCRNLRSTNCLLDFCYVADGRIGAAINQTMKIWDIAAPQLILEEAGAKVTDISGNEIIYKPSNDAENINFTAVAANKDIHSMIMKIVLDQ